MQTIREGNYGATIQKRNDGEGFTVTALYNMTNPTHDYSTGDVWTLKTYKTEKTAIKKAYKFIEEMKK